MESLLPETPPSQFSTLCGYPSSLETEELELLLETVRRFGREALDSAKIEEARGLSQVGWRQAKAIGLFGLTSPECFGGIGLSLGQACQVIEELATFDSSFSTTIGLHNGLGVRGLVRYGSPDLQARYFPKIASGDCVAAFSATEAEAGSHISNASTEARYDSDSRHFIVNGSKVFVTNGGLADLYTVLVRTPEYFGHKKGLSLLLIPWHLPGVVAGEEELKLGLKGSSTTSVYFNQVRVPEDHLLGQPGKALEYLDDILSWGRTLLSAGCIGNARRAAKKSLEYAQVRQQFGKPLSQFSLIQGKLSQQARTLFVMKNLTRWVEQSTLPSIDRNFLSALAKIVCSEGACEISDAAIQIHGGNGYVEESGIPRLYRDARITRIFEGTNEMLRLQTGLQILSWKPEVGAAMKLQLGDATQNSRFEQQVSLAQEGLNDLLQLVADSKVRLGFQLIKNQEALTRIADAGLAFFSMASPFFNGCLPREEAPRSLDLLLLNEVCKSERKRLADFLRDSGLGIEKAPWQLQVTQELCNLGKW
jgi:alkylation response protein AidB-like acyl-CoA dehydrogenase